MNFKSVKNLKNLQGKKVLLRVAYDVPLRKHGKSYIVADERRISETLPTIKYLLKQNCSIVLVSWLKRPGGKVVEKYRLDPVAKSLSKLLKKPVKKLDDCVGPKVFTEISKMKKGEIIMLENTRFYHQEEENDKRFSKLLIHGLDLIVFDAFAQAHRVHASTTGILKLLPAYAGLLFEKEIKALSKITTKPKKPMILIMGGAKISDKVAILEHLIKKADHILIGGGIANVFLKAKKIPIGSSYMQDVFVDKARRKNTSSVRLAKKLIKKYNDKLVLPVDLIAGSKMDERSLVEVIDLEEGEKIDKRWMFLDIGPKTVGNFLPLIKNAKTIFWNGPMGVFEIEKFSFATKKVAQAVGRSKALSIIGGGDTEVVVDKYKLEKKIGHVSTGGGASLEFLSGKEFPVTKYLIKHANTEKKN